MRNYELLAIFKPSLDSEEIDNMLSKVESTVTELGGKIVSIDKTGRKKLAYDIQNYRDGFFTTSIIALPAEKVVEFKRQLRLNDNILRTMFMESTSKVSA